MLPPSLGRTQLARFRGSSNTALDTFEQQPLLPSSQLQQNSVGQAGDADRMAGLPLAAHSDEGSLWSRGLTELNLWHWREHILDLAAMLALVTLFFALDKAPPRKPFVAIDALKDYSMPYKGNTVPPSSVLFFAYIFPLIVIVGFKLLVKGTWKDVYRTSVTLYFTVGLVGTLTNCLKLMIARPRPNFVARCWQGKEPVFAEFMKNDFGGYPECNCPLAVEYEHMKSFPSGHSSLTSAGLGFLTFCLLSYTRAFSGGSHPWRVLVSLMPALGAVLVGATRVMDYWHHPTDVLTGLFIGFSFSFLMHQHLFPWFTHPQSDELRCHMTEEKGGARGQNSKGEPYTEMELGRMSQESV